MKGIEDAAIVGVIILLVAAMVGYYMITKGFPTTEPKPPCVVTGCSGQVCADEEVITTCEFRPEYQCYRNARCERQEDGRCGWTMTPELQACLERYR